MKTKLQKELELLNKLQKKKWFLKFVDKEINKIDNYLIENKITNEIFFNKLEDTINEGRIELIEKVKGYKKGKTFLEKKAISRLIKDLHDEKFYKDLVFLLGGLRNYCRINKDNITGTFIMEFFTCFHDTTGSCGLKKTIMTTANEAAESNN